MLRSTSPPPPFPLYLIPSIPFLHRRQRSPTPPSPSTSPPTRPTSCLPSHPIPHLRCYKCLSDLAPTSAIISKGFTGRHGRAYLVAAPGPVPSVHAPGYTARLRSSNSYSAPDSRRGLAVGELPNTLTHKPVPRQLVTGAHTVSDISCRQCDSVLGWKYVSAKEESQRYKVGKFILETNRVVRGVGWENGDAEIGDLEMGLARGGNGNGAVAEAEDDDNDIEFDSQDEDECEDLFAGMWSPTLARRRRKRRFGQPDDDDDC